MSETALDYSDTDPIVEEIPPPLVLLYQVDGDYPAATISRAGNPDGANIDQRVMVRLVTATTDELLAPRITSCLIGEFGMSQEEADAVVPVTLVQPVPGPVARAKAEAKPAHDTKAGTHTAAAHDTKTTTATPNNNPGMRA